ncbi:Kojibiose phosphorylase [Legionella israelensis]|uniref:Alpha,alpha-trehalose phosphorylase n=2 Tax=Legionella israelensis TaxID=454 RepID=A0A0W0W367_9GAMM|nr:Alpha,alpha-trehalose phosphorylase [Legionella israelensis]QBS08580.1 glycoside hydrolase family 65 protein [Legionella israelensis]SCX75827.1 alpha,alpha-trehalose phosphorylase [Legionella israelensis DSM 19235]STX58234.1 Kojibiose phosphorylase [Legionella israelensis]
MFFSLPKKKVFAINHKLSNMGNSEDYKGFNMALHFESSGLITDSWCFKVNQFLPEQQMLLETLFAQANGYIGSRGSYEESLSEDVVSCEGVFLNGVYHQEPIIYGEKAYGFATHNQKILQVPNGKYICLSVDGEPLSACDERAEGQRELDFRTGVFYRQQKWHTQNGKKLTLKSRRFVSLANQHIMGIAYQITADNFTGSISLCSVLDAGYKFTARNEDDPRIGCLSIANSLKCIEQQQQTALNAFLHEVEGTDFIVASASLDILPQEAEHLSLENERNELLRQNYQIHLQKGQPVTFFKWIAYHHCDAADNKKTMLSGLIELMENVAKKGFEEELRQHQQELDEFWQNCDVVIEGDERLQQGIRFNLFHVFQSAGRTGFANIGAKGLTGHGYDGHYFWDTEIYVIPFLCFSQPEIARKLIEFRINTLPKARERARQMAHDIGALYPWRTIGGEECSAYFPAGTAQYHINAAIAYALKQYLNATDEEQILWDGGAEMLIETARLWMDLGHFNLSREGRFCIDGVTGPDEYTAIVNNNFYTNVMAQMHLRFAVEITQRLRTSSPKDFKKLAVNLSLTDKEINDWQKAADHMYLPFDESLQIHLQDDSFLNKKIWDFNNTPQDKYPLLLHFHPLVIYRHQVLKQADVILAMYLLDDQFDTEQKRRNLSYYAPITTHDSTLSACIHAIEYCETGDDKKAYSFFENTVRMDLDNHHANSEYGVHIACMSGSWACIVHGFAGFRARTDGLHFKPSLPSQWVAYSFRLRYRNQHLRVRVAKEGIVYELLKGNTLDVYHFNQKVRLDLNNPIQILSWWQENLRPELSDAEGVV